MVWFRVLDTLFAFITKMHPHKIRHIGQGPLKTVAEIALKSFYKIRNAGQGPLRSLYKSRYQSETWATTIRKHGPLAAKLEHNQHAIQVSAVGVELWLCRGSAGTKFILTRASRICQKLRAHVSFRTFREGKKEASPNQWQSNLRYVSFLGVVPCFFETNLANLYLLFGGHKTGANMRQVRLLGGCHCVAGFACFKMKNNH